MKQHHIKLLVAASLAAVLCVGVGTSTAFARSELIAWGDNSAGQTNVPSGLTNVLDIAAGGSNCLVRLSDGHILAWGDNTYGQTNAPALTYIGKISVGGRHCLAVQGLEELSRRAIAWGDNIYGQTNVPSFTAVAASGGEHHSLGLKDWSGGRAVAWGDNSRGQTNVPSDLKEVQAVAAGGYHSLALASDLTKLYVVAWGDNSYGQTNVPVGLPYIVQVAAGAYHSLALSRDGQVVAWGDNSRGQTNVPAGLSNVLAIAAGAYHNLALRSDGRVVAWGDNSCGQCNVPSGLSNVVSVAAGAYHSLAMAAPPPPSGIYDFEDNSFQGWTEVEPFNGILYLASGGNPGACLATWDSMMNGGNHSLRAPPHFTGNLAARAVGIEWDEYLTSGDGKVNTTLYIIGPENTWWENKKPPFAGQGAWLPRTALFVETNWTRVQGAASFGTTLSNVVTAFINVELHTQQRDEARIDNVRLIDPKGPYIVERPQARLVVPLGSNAVLTVTAGGDEPFQYQWQFRGVDILGANLPELALDSLECSNAGNYRVVVTNLWGSVTSDWANLIVAGVGCTMDYTLSLVPGFNLIANQLDNGGNTLAEIMPSVPEGTVLLKSSTGYWPLDQSAVFKSGEWDKPWITLSPGEGAFLWTPQSCLLTFTGMVRDPLLPLNLCVGYSLVSCQTPQIATYEDIVGQPPAVGTRLYRWNPAIQGYGVFARFAFGWSPSTPSAAVGEAVIIYSPFGGGCGGDCYFPPPAITVQPTNQTASCGTTVEFFVSAVGSAPLAYQWYYGGTALASQTTNSLVIPSADYSVAGSYYLVVTNSCGSATSYLAFLTISDTNPPDLLAWPTNRTINADASCQAQVPDLTAEVSASDNCGPVTIQQTPAAGAWIGLGQTSVNISVYDQAGNVAGGSVTLTVIDGTPPTITACATNRTLAAGPTCSTNLPDLTAQIIASDNCSSVTVTQSPPWGTALGLGQTVVTFSVRDAAGNSNGCTATVTVVDSTPPAIICPTNITTVCTSTNGAIVTFAPQVADNCDPAPTVTSLPASGGYFGEGITTVTCTARDSSGNTNSCTFTVTVIDPIPAILAIAKSPTNVLITWPQSCTRFVLEDTRALSPAPTWSQAGEPWILSGTNYCVEVVPDGTNRFFRLHRQ